jgi:hypothetical protein
MQYLARDLSYSYPHYHDILDYLTFKDDDGRTVLACYISMDILLKHMTANCAEIVLNVHNTDRMSYQNLADNLHFNANDDEITPNYQVTSTQNPCIVFRGITNIQGSNQRQLAKKITNLGINKILLASTARHPQYPGKQLMELKEDPFLAAIDRALTQEEKIFLKKIRSEFLFMKDWSLQNGGCLENHDTFFVTHIFCDQMDDYCKLISYDKEILSTSRLTLNDKGKYNLNTLC